MSLEIGPQPPGDPNPSSEPSPLDTPTAGEASLFETEGRPTETEALGEDYQE